MRLKKERAFSLIEIIIAMSIAVTAGTLLLKIMVDNSTLYTNQNAQVQQGLGLNDTLYKVRGRIKQAYGVALAYPEACTDNCLYTSGQDTLVLKIPTVDDSDNVLTATYDYYIYYIDSRRFYEKARPNVNSSTNPYEQILAHEAESVSFNYLDALGVSVLPNLDLAQKVRVTLTLKRNVGVNPEASTATSEAALRNN